MRIEPAFEGAMFLFEFKYLLRVDNSRVDLQPIANNARICQQTGAVFFGIPGNFRDVEFAIGFVEVIRLFENGDPR